MSDTEEIVIKRQPKNTKPEVAREKLKEKRERLKKEKEEGLIVEAKKRLLQEQQEQKQLQEQEELKKANDPTSLLMSKFDQMMALMIQKPKEEVEEKKTRKPRVKKEVVEEPVKKTRAKKEVEYKAPKPRGKKKVFYTAEDSPSNVFVGDDVAPPQPPMQYMNQYEQEPRNMLLAHLAGRRNMTTQYY
jgi:hypothetical protein